MYIVIMDGKSAKIDQEDPVLVPVESGETPTQFNDEKEARFWVGRSALVRRARGYLSLQWEIKPA